MKKIRLNDEQWKKLSSLLPISTPDTSEVGHAPKTPNRLSSHGLVAIDQRGREYLTDRGVDRLAQGR